MISINNNHMAMNTANSLNSHYNRLQTSVERLSSGLRINGADDDAAGLAVRELMRTKISALHQGVRNTNDAISMIQTFDGALGVIDEKLIRMKELAEQAATGTYDSTQRMMIDSEFQAMGSEIDRIARATDFNGVKLLCTNMMTWTTPEDRFTVTDPGSTANEKFTPATANPAPNMKIATNVNTDKYINATNLAATLHLNLQVGWTTLPSKTGNLTPISATEFKLDDSKYTMAFVDYTGNTQNPVIKYDRNKLTTNNGWTVTDDNHTETHDPFTRINFSPDNTEMDATAYGANRAMIMFALNEGNKAADLSDMGDDLESLTIDAGNGTYSITRRRLDVTSTSPDFESASYDAQSHSINLKLKNGGGSVKISLDAALNDGDQIEFDINMEGENRTVDVEHTGVNPNQKLKIHFGPENDSAEDYYYIQYANCTREGLGIDDVKIQTQQEAQEALVRIDDAIVAKDKVRANFGAMQNRLENTMTNLTTQAENLQAAESRISDTDIAEEMMNFVKNKILTQSATAMLAQANSIPQMVMALIP